MASFQPASKKRRKGDSKGEEEGAERIMAAGKDPDYWRKVVKEQIRKSHVLVYSKTTCPFCKRVNK